MMRKIIVYPLFLLLLLSIMSGFISGSWSSPNEAFNVTPDGVYLNWTNSYQGDVVLGMNSSYSGVLRVWNNSAGSYRHSVLPNYSQPQGNYPDYCGFNLNSFLLYVKNSTGSYTYNTTNLSGGEETTMTLLSGNNESCPPGRYWGYVNITNSTNPNEFYSLPLEINIPISSSNELNTTTGIGYFKGTLPAYADTYHSYYFNTSSVPNSTGITLKLSWSGSSDVDLFLFDESGNLKAKSINTGQSESLNYQYLPENKIWEIRLYGNSSSPINYQSSGQILFTTLNATNASNPSQQISAIDFGNMNTSDRKSVKIKLKNEGSLILNSVSQTPELYHTQTFSDTTPRNFSIRVPDFITRIKAEAVWSNGANYTISLYNSNDTQVDSSTNKYTDAGIAGAEKGEYVEYDPSGIVGLSDDGLWKIEIKNNTPTTGSYNLTVKEWVNPTGWVSTNYTTMTFNSSGHENDSSVVDFNFTVQNLTLSGIYRGFLKYTTTEGSVLKVPFVVNATTPELFVNNTFKQSTVNLKDNIGFNRTLVLNITINNTGNRNIVFGQDSNSSFLNHSSNYMEFSYDYPPSLAPGSSDTLNITINIDTTKTGNVGGLYTGWIKLNDTDSHPYSTFTITLQVNLTSEMTLFLREITTSDNDNWIEVPSSGQNFTIKAESFFANGTEVKDLNITNFGSVYLKNKNCTSYRMPVSGYLGVSVFSNPIFKESVDGRYWINVSIPGSSTRPGGYYDVYLSANRTEGGATLLGSTHNGTLIINQSALYLDTDDNSFTFDEGTTSDDDFNLTVVNYGPLEAKGTLTLDGSDDDDCDYADIDAKSYKTGCAVSKTSDHFEISVGEGKTCWFTWKLSADNTTADKTCTAKITTDDPRFNNISVTLHIEEIPENDENSDSESNNNNDNTDSSQEETKIEIIEYPSSLEIVQGETGNFTINVENPGNTDQDNLKLTITGIPETWYSFSPSDLDLDSLTEGNFDVNITPSKSAPVKTYNLTFKVSNSNVDVSKTSKLKVLPSEEEKAKVNDTYEKYIGNLTLLEKKMEELVSNNMNVTELNKTLEQIKNKLDSVNSSISSGDYFTADQILGEIESLLIQAENLSESSVLKTTSALPLDVSKYIWIIVGVISIAIVGFLVYLLLPPKEEYRLKSYGSKKHIKYVSPSSSETIDKKIKKIVKSSIRKIKNIFGRGKK